MTRLYVIAVDIQYGSSADMSSWSEEYIFLTHISADILYPLGYNEISSKSYFTPFCSDSEHSDISLRMRRICFYFCNNWTIMV